MILSRNMCLLLLGFLFTTTSFAKIDCRSPFMISALDHAPVVDGIVGDFRFRETIRGTPAIVYDTVKASLTTEGLNSLIPDLGDNHPLMILRAELAAAEKRAREAGIMMSVSERGKIVYELLRKIVLRNYRLEISRRMLARMEMEYRYVTTSRSRLTYREKINGLRGQIAMDERFVRDANERIRGLSTVSLDSVVARERADSAVQVNAARLALIDYFRQARIAAIPAIYDSVAVEGNDIRFRAGRGQDVVVLNALQSDPFYYAFPTNPS